MVYQSWTINQVISPTVAQVSVVVLPQNKNRKGLTIYNNGANSAYLTFGPVSTGSTPNLIIPSFQHIIMMGPVIWAGVISAIRNSGSGTIVFGEMY